MIILFLIDLSLNIDIGFFGGTACSGFNLAPISCSGELWEANSTHDWDEKYRQFLNSKNAQTKLTFGILHDSLSTKRRALRKEDTDALGAWSCEVDAFGGLVLMAALTKTMVGQEA